MKQTIIIHGAECYETTEDFYNGLKNSDYNPFEIKKKRRNRIAEQIQLTHQTIIPRMPNGENCDYIAWKIWFEKIFPYLNTEDTILIGLSQGGIFLSKWLSENTFPKKVTQLHLVAAPFPDTSTKKSYMGNFIYNPENITHLANQVKNIFIYQSQDDESVPFINAQKYKENLPNATLQTFKNRGHFHQETFPELLENIIS